MPTELERAIERVGELSRVSLELRAECGRRYGEQGSGYADACERLMRAGDARFAAEQQALAHSRFARPADAPRPIITAYQRVRLAERLFVDEDNEVRRWGRKAPEPIAETTPVVSLSQVYVEGGTIKLRTLEGTVSNIGATWLYSQPTPPTLTFRIPSATEWQGSSTATGCQCGVCK